MINKKILIAALVLCAVLLTIGLAPVHGEEKIYDTVVRLHVIANSDSEADQALKLRVRDAILEVTSPLMEGCRTQEEAKDRLERAIPQIRTAAETTIAEAGREDPVSVELGQETYPERDYDSFCFPAGEYLSLRVSIGEAEGKNWWCCLFPPLCLGSATVSAKEAEDACVEVGLTPPQYRIITETEKPVYRVRFKLLELFRSLW